MLLNYTKGQGYLFYYSNHAISGNFLVYPQICELYDIFRTTITMHRIQSKTHNRRFSNLYYHYIMPNLETNIIPDKYTLFYPPNVAAIIWVKCSFYVRNNHP